MSAVIPKLVALWADIFPVKGYTGGATPRLTSLFIQTPDAVQRANERIAALQTQVADIADDELRLTAERLLVVLQTTLDYPQPNQGVNTCGDGAFYILLKGDQKADWVPTYFAAIEQMLAFEIERWANQAFPIETKKGCLNTADYMLACVKSIRDQLPAVADSYQRICAQAEAYKQLFMVPGLDTQDFNELLEIFEEYEGLPTRTPGYPDVLNDLYNLRLTQAEIKQTALHWLQREMPVVRQTAAEIARQLKLPAGSNVQEVWDALSAHFHVPQEQVMATAQHVTNVCNAFADKYVIAIEPDEHVTLQETPDYMAPLVTGGQDLSVNYLTDHPSSALYLTPDKNTSLLTMINILVHEFSHGFNFVLSAMYAGSPLLNLDTPMQVAMTEGMAFYREFQYYQAAEDLVGQTGLNAVQQAYLDLYGSTPEDQAFAVLGAKLETYIWRIARYLRALCDVEVNMGETTYTDFLDWAHTATELSEEFINGECFSFLAQPGYAPCYAIPGLIYGHEQETGLRNGVTEKQFNTDASKLGFAPWSQGAQQLHVLAFPPAPMARVVPRATPNKPPEVLMAGATREDINGWIVIHISGEPYDRGFQHGSLLGAEIQDALRVGKFLSHWDTGMPWDYFIENAMKQFPQHIDPEIVAEMQGIADGATQAGYPVMYEEILTWNGYQDIVGSWWPNRSAQPPARMLRKGHHCSAFIATGNATATGEIVMGHNTWDRYASGDHYNIVIDLKPANGHSMLFQAAPGYVSSTMDWWITDAGLVVCETTIGGFSAYNSAGAPEFYRSRRACQDAGTMKQWTSIINQDSNGGYANSWLVGDLNTNQIARIELGLPMIGVQTTASGHYAGYNTAENLVIRDQECSSESYSDIRQNGSRRLRFMQLFGSGDKVDVTKAQAYIADHYDVYLQRANNPCSRTVCGHLELDDAKYGSHAGQGPFYPWGACDGKVLDAEMARQMKFMGRWGHACGMPFDPDAFIAEHPQYAWLDGYMKQRDRQPWVELAAAH